MTDTHTHLYSNEYDQDRDIIIQRAINNGIDRFFIPAINSHFVKEMYALEAKYPNNMFLMAGLHPTYVKENYIDELDLIEKQLSNRQFVAIGEIGIDLYWDKTRLKEQQIAFRKQIHLAKKYQLPIVIHCREAFNEIFEILESEKGDDLFGIFHCFSGTYKQALQAISYNMKLGIGGIITFKNSKIDQFIHNIDLKHIVLETDSPYLAPVPFRGKRNESSYLTIIAEKVASLYGIPIAEVTFITTENSKNVFNI